MSRQSTAIIKEKVTMVDSEGEETFGARTTAQITNTNCRFSVEVIGDIFDKLGEAAASRQLLFAYADPDWLT